MARSIHLEPHLSLDEVRAAGHITSDLVAELHEADFCIADMTDPNANVMWEVGYAAALTKPTIVIRHSTGVLPFDVKDVRVVQYALDALPQLESDLVEVIGQTVRRYQARRIYLPHVPRRRLRLPALWLPIQTK